MIYLYLFGTCFHFIYVFMIIENNIDGILVKNGDVIGLADKICFLIENESVRKEMGIRARHNVERFKIENIALQWKNLFESVTN